MSRHRALREGRHSSAGQIYWVTFATKQRQRLFEDHEAARIVARSIADRRLWYRSGLLAWVLMPDHWHGLVELGCFDELSVVVQRLKTNTARSLRSQCPAVSSVWSAGFHDRAVRPDENLLAAARYLVANPVRAGLVRKVGEYPYWNAVWV